VRRIIFSSGFFFAFVGLAAFALAFFFAMMTFSMMVVKMRPGIILCQFLQLSTT
jgi:hypothetical protein